MIFDDERLVDDRDHIDDRVSNANHIELGHAHSSVPGLYHRVANDRRTVVGERSLGLLGQVPCT